MVVDCEFFEIIDWNEETNEIYNAVCTMPSPIWPNCNRCQHREEYMEDAPKPVPTTPPSPSDKVLLKTQLIKLTQGDVDILDGSVNRKVRIDIGEDTEVKRLYHIYKSL